MSEEKILDNPQPSGIELDDVTGNVPPADGSEEPQASPEMKPDEKGTKDNPNPELYGAPENYDYSGVKLPDEMVLDEDMLAKFNPIAKELNLSNESANRLMSLAVELTGKQAANFTEAQAQLQIAEKNSYLKLLDEDKELNSYNTEEYDQYLTVAKLGVNKFATEGFKKILKDKGLANHPDFIKTFHAIGNLCKEDTVGGNNTPAGTKETPAQILYGNS